MLSSIWAFISFTSLSANSQNSLVLFVNPLRPQLSLCCLLWLHVLSVQALPSVRSATSSKLPHPMLYITYLYTCRAISIVAFLLRPMISSLATPKASDIISKTYSGSIKPFTTNLHSVFLETSSLRVF